MRQASLVLVTESAFHPPYQGDSARLAAMIAFFRGTGWRVCVVHFHDRHQHDADYAGMAARCERLEIYRATDEELARRRGSDLDAWCPPEFAALVARVVAEEAARAVIAQFVFFSRVLEGLPSSVLRVLDADNTFEARAELYRSAGLAYTWFSTDHAQEARGLARADLVLAIQEREYERFACMGLHDRIMLVPHAREAVRLPDPAEPELLFVGAGNVENTNGLLQFLNVAWPLVRAAHPGARLRVAGRVARVVDEGTWPGVVGVGVRDDLTALYATTAIVINPVPIGTGLKIKTVDALCHGRCLVSLPAGVQGLERFPETHVRVDDLVAMAAAVIGLLDSPSGCRARASAAFEFASSYFAPERVFGPLQSFLRVAERGKLDRDLGDRLDDRRGRS